MKFDLPIRLLMALAVALGVAACDPITGFYVQVVDSEGLPIEGVTVNCLDLAGTTYGEDTTDSLGCLRGYEMAFELECRFSKERYEELEVMLRHRSNEHYLKVTLHNLGSERGSKVDRISKADLRCPDG